MVKEKYLSAVKNVTDMNKNRLNPQCNPKEQEMDELFYWIMSAIESSINSCWPAKTSHSITLREPYFSSGKCVMLEYRDSSYFSQYVTREEFYSVMQEVAAVFNEIGKMKKTDIIFGRAAILEMEVHP